MTINRCCTTSRCDCEKNCEAMPITDLYQNPEATDRILATRTVVVPTDGCTVSPRCQTVSVDQEMFIDSLRGELAAVDPGDSVAVTIAALVIDYNTLLANLRTAGLIA